jgi:hypothetical protein
LYESAPIIELVQGFDLLTQRGINNVRFKTFSGFCARLRFMSGTHMIKPQLHFVLVLLGDELEGTVFLEFA